MTDLDVTPKKNEGHGTKLRRSYAILDIASLASDADAAEGEHKSQVSNDGYEPHESQGHAADEEFDVDDEPTPKKKQKTVKVPVRDAINANRREQEPRKAENKVGRLIVYLVTN